MLKNMVSGCKWGVVVLLSCCLFHPLLAQNKQPSTNVKLVTWNIQMLPNALAPFSAALRKKQRLRHPWIVKHCIEKDYDVIVFQEVFDRNIKKKLKRDLKETYPYQVDTRRAKGRMTSNGILIVSRLPMHYVDHVIYEKGVTADAYASKGCTLVEVQKDSITFQLAGTHLQAGGSEKARQHRDQQYVAIRQLLDENASAQKAVFLLGDMNTRKADTSKYPLMLQTIGVSDQALNDPRPYTIDRNNSWNKKASRNSQLDYVLLQKRKTATKILKQQVLRPTHTHKGKVIDLADHYGIVADVVVTDVTQSN